MLRGVKSQLASGLVRSAFLTSALLVTAMAMAGSASPTEELFRVERSTNRNVVEYDIRLLPDGNVDKQRPIDAYWRLLAEDGRREQLTWLEGQLAYGFSVEPRSDGFVLTLRPLAHRAVRVTKSGGHWRAAIKVSGKPAILRRVWVQAEGSLFGPRVRWVELHATDERTGEPLVERISND